MMKPKISVLLATCNGEKYLGQLLNSLKHQKFKPYEVVVSDDNSSDQTIKLVSDFKENSGLRTKIIVNDSPKGSTENFFNGIDYCEGEYIAFCDQDDIWLEDKLLKYNQILSTNPSLNFIFSNTELVDSNLRYLNQRGFDFLNISNLEKQFILNGNLFEVLVNRPIVVGMTMLIKKNALGDTNERPCYLPHDYIISCLLSLQESYYFFDEPLVLYRQHDLNQIGYKKKAKKVTRNKKTYKILNDDDYVKHVNRYLIEKLELIKFLQKKVIVDNNKKKYKDFLESYELLILKRIARRSSIKELFIPIKSDIRISQLLDSKTKIWFDDLKIYIRLKIKSLFF